VRQFQEGPATRLVEARLVAETTFATILKEHSHPRRPAERPPYRRIEGRLHLPSLVARCLHILRGMSSSVSRFLMICLGSAALTGCTTMQDMVASHIPSTRKGRASIVVRLDRQQAFLLRGGQEVAEAHVSTGREGYRTPTGRFRVIRKDRDHRSSIYGDFVDDYGVVVKSNVDVRKSRKPPGTHFVGAPMPYFVEFKPGYGLHAGHLPGYPASHGCVRMSYWKARQFYRAVRIGTRVRVTR